MTVDASALTSWRRRRPVPLAVSVVSAVWVYSFVYLVGGGHGAAMADHMAADHATSHSTSFGGGRLVAVWLGLAVLVGSQIWDLVDIGRRGSVDHAPCSDAAGS
jgi:hypothetical protein